VAREVDGDEVGGPDGETKAVTEAEWHPLALADGERDTRALPLPRPLRLELPVSLAERASVLLPVAVSSGDGEGRGERDGTADAHEVADAKIVCVSRPDRVSAGEDEALFSVLPDGTDVGDASCDRVVEEDAQIEPEGDPEALSRALGDADPHSDAASVVGVPTPLAVALLLPEGPTVGLPKGDCVAEVLVRAEPLPPEVCECEPLALAQELPVGKPAEGDNEEVGVPALLLVFKGVPLPPEVFVCEPLALAQGLPVGKPAEGEEEEVGVPASLLVLKGVLDAVSRTVRDGAAFVGVSQAVEVVLAAGDGDAEKVGRVVDEGEEIGVIDCAPLLLGLPVCDPPPTEAVAKKETLAELLAPPDAVIGGVSEAGTDTDMRMVGVAQAEAEMLLEKTALPDRVAVELALGGTEKVADTEATEPLEHGVALLVPAADCDGMLLPDGEGLSAAVGEANNEGVADSVLVPLPGDDPLAGGDGEALCEEEASNEEEAAGEEEAPAVNVPPVVAERVLKKLGEERAVHVASTLREACTVALAVLLSSGDKEKVAQGDDAPEREAEAQELVDALAALLIEAYAVALPLKVGVETPEADGTERVALGLRDTKPEAEKPTEAVGEASGECDE
jgi:hypothetical protein